MPNQDLEKRLYQIFDPEPLEPANTELYVDLNSVRGDRNVVTELKKAITLSDKPTCQILAGHRGSGKSTELRKLQAALEADKYFVVFCKADEDIERNDVDFPEVLIAIVRQMARQLAEKADIKPKPGYFAQRWDDIKSLFGSEVQFEKVELGDALGKVSAAIKASPDVRGELRKALEPRVASWLAAANDLIGKATAELSKKRRSGLVIIVDDLDKMILRPHNGAGCTTGEYLFIHREAQLRAFQCHMVYTMPLALAYSAQERNIASFYGGEVPVVPMTKVRKRPPDQTKHDDGVAKFRELIALRLDKAGIGEREVFADDAVRDELIMLSGGQPRELMILMREAIISGQLPLTKKAIERPALDIQRAFARQLRVEHWPLIEEVRKTGKLKRSANNDLLIRELLDSRVLLQYRNDDEWYDVNPLVPDHA